MASVVRLRILRMCRYESLTNKEIAERLGRNPASVLHHVRTLVAQGFLVPGEIRRGPRGSREVPYASTGKSWTLDVPLSQSDDVLLRTFLEEVSQVPTVQVRMTRLGLQLSEAHRQEFLDRLHGLLDEFARRDLDPDGIRESLFLAIHPEP
jgi:predicted transcriptional regulator